jgi:hypothetical protein
MADPMSADGFPRVSDAHSLEEGCAIWETLHYALQSLLGWNDPGAGLAWWYAHGKPTADCTLLQIVSTLWDREHQLDYYTAWAWSYDINHCNPDDISSTEFAKKSRYHDQEWWADLKRRGLPRWVNPFYGGGNPLHLGHSNGFGYDVPPQDHAKLHVDASSRRAVLIVNHLGAWRRDLDQAGQRLPPIGERSWHVEVFDRQTGYLGLFRRSRETGCWFQGKHSLHMKGYCPEIIG